MFVAVQRFNVQRSGFNDSRPLILCVVGKYILINTAWIVRQANPGPMDLSYLKPETQILMFVSENALFAIAKDG